jgi:hypothetical protein
LTTWAVNGVGLGYSKVLVSAASCQDEAATKLAEWLTQRYGDRVELQSCQGPSQA